MFAGLNEKTMTKNNSLKKTVRARVAETGESYIVALQHVAKGEPTPKLTAEEFGEDGGFWYVEGTSDEQTALAYLKKWLVDTYSYADGCNDDWLLEDLKLLEGTEVTFRSSDDFYFRERDSSDQGRFGDFFLESKAECPEKYTGQDLMSGVSIRIY